MTLVVCTDGSDLALQAATAGVALLRQADTIVVVTVVDDIGLVDDSTGHAGPSMTAEEIDAQAKEIEAQGEAAVAQLASALGSGGIPSDNVETRVVLGSPGRAI